MTTVIPNIDRRDLFSCHLASVDTLANAGIEPPKAWTELRARYTDYVELGATAADRLAAEIITPLGADLVALRNCAIVDELTITGPAEARVSDTVRTHVLKELQRLYGPAAQQNYDRAAQKFNSLARQFSDCARATDVEADGNSLIHASSAERQAWMDAPTVAGALEESLRPLLAAAVLCGAPPTVAFLGQASDIITAEHQIAIACVPGKAHRRRVWEGWLTTGRRTGRWGALHAAGVRLKASDRPADVTPYQRPPKPIPVLDNLNRVRNFDPCDGPLPKGWRNTIDGWQGANSDIGWDD